MTRAQLENPSDLFANSAKAVLLADSPAWPFTPYAHRYLGAMDNNRVEIVVTDTGRASDHMNWANVGGVSTPYYDHRTARFAFAVVSSRADQATTDNHAYCVGRLGYLCSRDAQKFVGAAIQNLQILEFKDDGASHTVDEKTDRDRTLRSFEITYIIPPAVFSSATV